MRAGEGFGDAYIYDDHYRQIAGVQAGNGYTADSHEFLITPQDTALITIYAQTRDEKLMAYEWAFARRTAFLAVLKAAPAGGYYPGQPWDPTKYPPTGSLPRSDGDSWTLPH